VDVGLCLVADAQAIKRVSRAHVRSTIRAAMFLQFSLCRFLGRNR